MVWVYVPPTIITCMVFSVTFKCVTAFVLQIAVDLDIRSLPRAAIELDVDPFGKTLA